MNLGGGRNSTHNNKACRNTEWHFRAHGLEVQSTASLLTVQAPKSALFCSRPGGEPFLSGLEFGFSWPARIVVGLSRTKQTVLGSIFSFQCFEFLCEIKLTWFLNTYAFQGEENL